MIDKILEAIDWRLRITGDGVIHVMPPATEETYTFDPYGNDVIETQITVNEDLFSAPNVFAAISNDITAIAKDESSPLSITARGREVWQSEQGVNLADNETIEGYALRKLKEAQDVRKTASYQRRYIPDLLPSDLIHLRYSAQELDGIFSVESQSITLGHAARTSEEVKKWTESVN